MSHHDHALLQRYFTDLKMIDSNTVNFLAVADGRPTKVFYTLRNNQVTAIEEIPAAETMSLFQYVVVSLNKHAPQNFSMGGVYHDIYIPHGVFSEEYDVHGIMLNQGAGRVILGLTMGLSNEMKDKIDKSSAELRSEAIKYGYDLKGI